MKKPLIEVTRECAKGVFVVNGDSKAAMSAARKISEHSAPGAIIPLTQEEFDAVCNGMVNIWKLSDEPSE